jgi:hypothetical protein
MTKKLRAAKVFMIKELESLDNLTAMTHKTIAIT